jgi:NTE family protein
MNWLTDLGLGGWLGAGRGKALLRTEPLRELVARQLDFDRIDAHLRDGHLHGLALTATHYGTGTSTTFFDAATEIQPWIRSTRLAVRTRLRAEHVLASTAIPLFFPAVEIDGAFYGDGCIRLTTPFSPAIHLGAERILAIGVRHERTADHVEAINGRPAQATYPSLAQIGGVLLNSLFLDALEGDAERLARINQTVAMIHPTSPGSPAPALRQVPILVIKPSVDLGALARDHLATLPATLRYFFRGMGISHEGEGADLLSYLAFDSAYTSKLTEIGRRDALARGAELREFLGFRD